MVEIGEVEADLIGEANEYGVPVLSRAACEVDEIGERTRMDLSGALEHPALDVVHIGFAEARPMIAHLPLPEPFEGRAHLLTEVVLAVGDGDRHLEPAKKGVVAQFGEALSDTAGIRAHIGEGQ